MVRNSQASQWQYSERELMDAEHNKQYDEGYYDGKDYARRSTPRIPTQKEYMDVAQVFSDRFDYDFDEAWAILLRAYVAIFEGYKSETGFVCKIACVQYETGAINFDHYKWAGGSCEIIERAV